MKVWIEADGEHVFCSGMCRILEPVAHTGSIETSAAHIGLSDRHVWARLQEMAFGDSDSSRAQALANLSPAANPAFESYYRAIRVVPGPTLRTFLPCAVNDALWRSSGLSARADSRSVSAGRDMVVLASSGVAAAPAVHLLDFNLDEVKRRLRKPSKR